MVDCPNGDATAAVVRVAQSCGSTHEQAMDALTICDDDEDLAIAFLSDPSLQLNPIQQTRPPDQVSSGSQPGLIPVESTDLPEEVLRSLSAPRRASSPTQDAAHSMPSTSDRQPHIHPDRLPQSYRSGPRQVVETVNFQPRELEAEAPPYALPVLSSPRPLRQFKPGDGLRYQFSTHRLIWAVKHNEISGSHLLEYFSYFGDDVIATNLNLCLEGVPAIFYAAQANNCEIVRIWVEHGGDVDAQNPINKMPLLGFAILNSLAIRTDTSALTATLLSLGANVSDIPKSIYSPYLQETSRSNAETEFDEDWCKGAIGTALASTVNLTQRYFLTKQAQTRPALARLRAAARKLGVSPLFYLPYHIVGQEIAVKSLIDIFICHLATDCNTPLVLLFVGPSGHGKTELGRRLGDLLSLDITSEDMASMRNETDLFGAKMPYVGCDKGSPLNNFLSMHSGQRAIIFLDEFERSSPEVHNALLIPFGEGRYIDRRTGQPVDCSKVIWVLASNALDRTVQDYYDKRSLKHPSSESTMDEAVNDLQAALLAAARGKLGFPMAGRLSTIVPFIPFSAGEQAILAHKSLLGLAENLRKPVQPPKRLVGNVRLRIRQDTAVCQAIAREGYHVDTGARGIEAVVMRKVKNPLVQKYLETNREISEQQPEEIYEVDVDRSNQVIVRRMPL